MFRNEDNNISKSTVIHTVQHFEETKFVTDRVRQGRLATNLDKTLNILFHLINIEK